jgi:hypothetical protein
MLEEPVRLGESNCARLAVHGARVGIEDSEMREGCHEPGVGPIVAAQLIVAWSHHGRARLRFTGCPSLRRTKAQIIR